mmetsp:Transcript_2761/g.7556  ORF Transcript_2761/g.7556 Transcript_2761/m.7556 type:complete len:605 (-) Transcript_2761:40-1854(-)
MFGSLFARRQDSFHNEEQGAKAGSPRYSKRRFAQSPRGAKSRPSLQLDLSARRQNKSTGSHSLSTPSGLPLSDQAGVASSKFSPDPLALVRKLPVDASAAKLQMKRGKSSLLGSWESYFGELRGALLVCFTSGKRPRVWNAQEGDSNLKLLAYVVGCEVSRTKSDVVRLKKDGYFVSLRLESKSLCDRWEEALRLAASAPLMGLSDFDLLAPIGKGAAGKVFFVRDKKTGERLALKVIDKALSVLDCQSSYRHAVDERLLLQLVDAHPFFVQMRYAFQTQTKLYLAMEFCDGGDLFYYLHFHQRPLHEQEAKRVVAEVILALQEMHRLGFVYRDLKPENILLDAQGHIRLADFGLSKKLEPLGDAGAPMMANGKVVRRGPGGGNARSGYGAHLQRTKTVCGTHAYVAPEMVSGMSYGLSVDVWTLGIFLYHILVGRPPFEARSLADVKRNFEKLKIRFYEDIMSQDAIKFLMGLLTWDVDSRAGCISERGLEDLKQTAFFTRMDWQGVIRRLRHQHGLQPPAIVHNRHPRALPGKSLDEADAFLLRNFNLDEWVGVLPDADEEDLLFSDEQLWPPVQPERKIFDASYIAGFSFSSRKIKPRLPP